MKAPRPQPSPSSKVIRAAVIAGETVQDELHQTRAEPVTVGTDYRSDLLVSGTRAPVRHRLFDVQGGAYFLDVPPGTRGKIRLGRQALTVGQLRRRFGEGEQLRLRLEPGTRGKLLIGDATVLFQFAKPKPIAPKLPLPKIFKASAFGMLGALFIYSQLGSLAALGPIFAWAYLSPLPEESSIEIDERFLTVVGSPRLLEPKPEEEEPKEKLLAQEDDQEKVEKKDEEPEPDKEEPPEEFSERAVAQARTVGIARVLGTYGGEGPGSVLDVIGSTENNLGELMAMGMTTTVLADGGPIGAFVGGDGISLRGNAVETEGFKTGDGPTLSNKAEKSERKVNASVKGSTQSVAGGGDPRALRAYISRRIRGLKACYEKQLRVNPQVGSGNHTYTIDINVMGRVTAVAIEEDTLGSPSVADCAKVRIKAWRFPMDGAEDDAELTFSVLYSG